MRDDSVEPGEVVTGFWEVANCVVCAAPYKVRNYPEGHPKRRARRCKTCSQPCALVLSMWSRGHARKDRARKDEHVRRYRRYRNAEERKAAKREQSKRNYAENKARVLARMNARNAKLLAQKYALVLLLSETGRAA